MAKEYLFDDYEDEDDDEFYERRQRGKELRKSKEYKAKERKEAVWGYERATRER